MASNIIWDIRLEGRAREKDKARERYQLTPEKFEMSRGKLFWNGEDRLNMLGMMLENLGARKVVRLGRSASMAAGNCGVGKHGYRIEMT